MKKLIFILACFLALSVKAQETHKDGVEQKTIKSD